MIIANRIPARRQRKKVRQKMAVAHAGMNRVSAEFKGFELAVSALEGSREQRFRFHLLT